MSQKNSDIFIVQKDHVKTREVLKLQQNQTPKIGTTKPLNADIDREAVVRALPKKEINKASDLCSSET